MKVLEIVTADEAGFCFGVRRALDMTMAAAEEHNSAQVFTLGPIIHNPQVVSKLEKLGVSVIEDVNDIKQGILIIRSHGIAPVIMKKAREQGLHIIDTTCPYVKNAQKYANRLVKEGYQTFIYGDNDHPEVKGIYGATEGKGVIINNIEDMMKHKIEKRVGFVAQTTKSPASYQKMVTTLIPYCEELKIYNTICNTTVKRQSSASSLAQEVEIMLVIGGFNSANTRQLAEICGATGTPTYHIETVDDIDWKWFVGKEKVGITAGASTPDWLIKEVIQVMSEEKNELTQEEQEKVEEVEEVVEEEIPRTEEEVEAETSETTEEEVEAETSETTEETAETTESVPEESEVEEQSDSDETEKENVESSETESAEEETEESLAAFKYSDNEIADLKKGQTVCGTVVEVNDDGIYVDVGYKTEGFVPLRELSHRSVDDPRAVVEEDEEIDVVILTLEDDEGNMILSKRKADYEKAWERIMEAYEDEEIIEAEVTKEVKGGLVVDVGVRGFIPASHVAIGYVEDLSKFVNETLRLKVIEVEREKNNVVLSAKKVFEEEREEQKEETLNALEEGQEIEGKVTKLVDFGAFIDLGGIEGLLHISEMSWGRIEHPSEVLTEGEDVEVKVLGVNREDERISLGLKQLMADPWEEFAERHYEGEIIDGKITKIVDFGAFMEIEDGIEGLIHISQLSRRHVKTPDEVVTVHEERKAKIINIDAEQKRVGLSLKELEDEEPAKKENKGKTSQENNKSKSDEKIDTPSGATIGELVGDIFDKNDN